MEFAIVVSLWLCAIMGAIFLFRLAEWGLYKVLCKGKDSFFVWDDKMERMGK